jgi:hypothetical protein
MTAETLLSAARRFVRFFNIDESHGGLISHDTLIARDQLQIQLDKERRKVAEDEMARKRQEGLPVRSEPSAD